MIAEIRSLNPKPGLAFGSTAGAADRAGRVSCGPVRTAAASSNSTPTRCRRSWSTSAITPSCRRHAKADSDKTYLAENLQSATWLMRALDQRAKTILKVATEIVQTAGRVLRARRAASAPAQPQDHRRRHQHARIDGVARHRQQIHGDQPRHLRAEIFLHLVDRRRPMAARRIPPRRCATASSS